MTSIKAAVAIAVAAVIVIAAGAYVLWHGSGGGGGDDSTVVDAIGADVSVGDTYTLSTSGPDGVAEDTTYTVTAVDGENLTVEVSSGSATNRESMSTGDFLDDVSVVDMAFIGEYRGTDVIRTPMGTIECMVYVDTQQVGNASTVTARDYIGVGTNIIYRTDYVIENGSTSETFTTTLVSTNMIQSGSSGAVDPGTSGDIRTDLRAGDYIRFTKYDDGRDIEELIVVSVSGDTVIYRERGDDDLERTTVSSFLSLIVHDGTGTLLGTETVDTAFGNISCNVYEMGWRFGGVLDFDREDRVVVYASQDDGVIYKIEAYEDYHSGWGGTWYDDYEAYYLTETSLMGSSGSSGSEAPETPSAGNRYGVELQVGDGYTVTDGRETETYEIVAISGDRLTVKETDERGRVEYDRTSANGFLDDILLTERQLLNWYTQDGDWYVESHDDDPDRIRVVQLGENYVILEVQEWERGTWVTDETVSGVVLGGTAI